MSESNCLEKPTASVLALAATLVGSPGQVQVPVIDNARPRIQQATLNWHQCYQTDTRKLKGASGGTTDRVGLAAASQRAPNQQEVARIVADEAIRQEVDPNFALAIAEQESGFHQSAHSAAGAIGLMQLMPGTAAELGVDPHDICDNIRGGVKYIKQLYGKYGNRPDFIAAGYNAGPNRQSLRNGQIPNIPETRDYVKKVLAIYSRNKAKNGDRTRVKRPPSPRP
ncbi:transglycosylase SLT domain-containing protein [Neorhizobium galegae]|uniref:Transglycosylase SLT domain-containing protein n=1 Tax=Neorhizobium galegae TaxID=399 RepID=A0A6A1TLL8_NEOGA|nr:transglycosylase SLT domain-containing protein [Neorhizobium galegae]KAB1083927.1 transglycosylase SLT domain-containing protein [Neorhizobium galegae]